jgi:hypothetical protein
VHVDSIDNKVANCISRYYENHTGDESHLEHIFMNTDVRLDPDGELLPTDRYMELKTTATRCSNCLVKKREAQILESKELNDSAQRALPKNVPPSIDDDDIVVSVTSGDGTTLRAKVEDSLDLPKILCEAQGCHVLQDHGAPWSTQEIQDKGGADLDKNQLRHNIVCVPQNVFHRGRRLIKITINHTHQTVGNYSQLETLNYIQRAYWWLSMATDIKLFCT